MEEAVALEAPTGEAFDGALIGVKGPEWFLPWCAQMRGRFTKPSCSVARTQSRLRN
jgi:hypothetical protein